MIKYLRDKTFLSYLFQQSRCQIKFFFFLLICEANIADFVENFITIELMRPVWNKFMY